MVPPIAFVVAIVAWIVYFIPLDLNAEENRRCLMLKLMNHQMYCCYCILQCVPSYQVKALNNQNSTSLRNYRLFFDLIHHHLELCFIVNRQSFAYYMFKL